MGPTTPWDDEVEEAGAGVEIIKARSEEASRRAVKAKEEADEIAHRCKEEQARREMEARLQELKSYGRNLAANLPPEWKARVVTLLEDFVTERQFPTTLNAWDAYAIIQDRVDRVRVRADQERARAEEERARADQARRDALLRQVEEARRGQQLERLIKGGQELAYTETLLWGTDAELARRDIDRELRAQVRWDWSEAEVRELVLDLVREWNEGDDDQESDEDGDWDDEDGEEESWAEDDDV